MKAVILAAGLGTRLNNNWTIVPKPLIEVGNRRIIEHVILNLKESGINEFLIITGFMSEHIKDFLRDGTDLNVSIKYIYNKDYKKDSIFSLLKAKDHIEGPFIVSMADLFFDSSVISELLEESQSGKNLVLVDKKVKDARRIEEKAKVLSEGSQIQQIAFNLDEFNALDCGIYLFQDSIFKTIEEQENSTIQEVLTSLSKKDLVHAIDIKEKKIIDVDREKDVEHIIKEIMKNER
jgi:choline kinase